MIVLAGHARTSPDLVAELAAQLSQPSDLGAPGAWAEKIDITGARKFDAANERGFMD